MSNLKNVSVDELKAELAAREEEARTASLPAVQENIDWSELIKTCVEYRDSESKGEGDSDDLQHYIYEEAMKAVFGPNYFKWVCDR